jgi:hypothetical protein
MLVYLDSVILIEECTVVFWTVKRGKGQREMAAKRKKDGAGVWRDRISVDPNSTALSRVPLAFFEFGERDAELS